MKLVRALGHTKATRRLVQVETPNAASRRGRLPVQTSSRRGHELFGAAWGVSGDATAVSSAMRWETRGGVSEPYLLPTYLLYIHGLHHRIASLHTYSASGPPVMAHCPLPHVGRDG